MDQAAPMLRRQAGRDRFHFRHSKATVRKRRKRICRLPLHGSCTAVGMIGLQADHSKLAIEVRQVQRGAQYDVPPPFVRALVW